MGCKQSKDDPVHTFILGHELHFGNNEMHEVEIGLEDKKQKVIVAKYLKKYYAFGNTCPHYGAPLAEGAFRHGKIRCPWHGACFDAATGDIEDYPGIECIQTFKVVRSKVGQLTIKVHESEFKCIPRLKPLCRAVKRNKSKKQSQTIENIETIPALQTIVIIGSGAAGFTCAVTLRQRNFDGRIVMITSDWFHPYDRTKLTKNMNNHWADIKLQDESFYIRYDIEVMTNSTVEKVDFTNAAIQISNSRTILNYNKLLIATGLKPRVYDIEGSNLSNIFTIYSLKDTQRVFIKAQGKKVVILGSSFIAMEMACCLDQMAVEVTVVCKAKWPFGYLYGRRIGTAILVHMIKSSRKVRFKMLDEVRAFKGNAKGEVTAVITLKKNQYPCDVVIVAAGSVANTQFLEKTRISLIRSNKTIPIGKHMKTTVPNVFAAGDVTTFPSAISVAGHASIAHWGVACKHGEVAALNMLGVKTDTFYTVPFHWATFWGKTIRYVGNGKDYNEVIIFGNLTQLRFCALYRRDGIILAGATCDCDPIASHLAFDLQHHVRYHRTEYPLYITDVFEDPPHTGERYIWVKFEDKEDEKEFSVDDARRRSTLGRNLGKAEQAVTNELEFETDKQRAALKAKLLDVMTMIEEQDKKAESRKLKHLQPIDRNLEHRSHHL